MEPCGKGKIVTEMITQKNSRNRVEIVGFIKSRVGFCGQVHEGRGGRQNYAKHNLEAAIRACPDCQKVLSDAQPQPAAV